MSFWPEHEFARVAHAPGCPDERAGWGDCNCGAEAAWEAEEAARKAAAADAEARPEKPDVLALLLRYYRASRDYDFARLSGCPHSKDAPSQPTGDPKTCPYCHDQAYANSTLADESYAQQDLIEALVRLKVPVVPLADLRTEVENLARRYGR